MLYLLKAFSELDNFLCLFMFSSHPSFRVMICFDDSVFVIVDIVCMIYCMLRFSFLIFLIILRNAYKSA